MIPILGQERTTYSADEVREMLTKQAEQIMNDQFVNLYFACIQLGFSERIKAHKSWSEDTANGLANQAHQTVTAAFARLGRGQREKQVMLAKAMAEAERQKKAKLPEAEEVTPTLAQEEQPAAESQPIVQDVTATT